MSETAQLSEGLTVAGFAEAADCHERQVRRALTRGKLSKDASGLIPRAQLDTPWRKQNRRTRVPADNSPDNRSSVRPVVRTEPDNLGDLEDLPQRAQSALDDLIRRVRAGDYHSEGEALKIKANANALRSLMAAERDAGGLISAEMAERLFFQEARALHDAWRNVPSRIGPLLAAALNVDSDRLTYKLAEHVHQQLVDLGEPEVDFHDDD